MQALDILRALIRFPSVAGTDNTAISGWIADYLSRQGATVRLLSGPDAGRYNLLASFGPPDVSGLILSGHMDVVPAGEAEWRTDPFEPFVSETHIFGRGSTDMKGFLAAAMAVAPGLKNLARPVHLAFSYDEELGCRGVPHLIATLPEHIATPFGCIVGEPSELSPVLGHKGKAAIRCSVHGISGHSSRPELGLNAIHGAASLINSAILAATALEQGPTNDTFTPPWSTLQVGVFHGGQAVNIIPDLAEICLEARAVPGVDPLTLLASVECTAEELRARGYRVEQELLSSYPGLMLSRDTNFARSIAGFAIAPVVDAVSYGTEAGLFHAAGIDTLICGPGSIVDAHKPNEALKLSELAAAHAFLGRVVDGLCR